MQSVVTGGKLWWADEESAQLGTVTKRDGRNMVILRNKTSGVVHMKVYDREGQKGKQAYAHLRTEIKTQEHAHLPYTLMVPCCLPFADCASHSGRNPCQINNGGCSQLCFPTSENTRSCSCTVGYNLRSDRMSCEGTFPKIRSSQCATTIVVLLMTVTRICLFETFFCFYYSKCEAISQCMRSFYMPKTCSALIYLLWV